MKKYIYIGIFAAICGLVIWGNIQTHRLKMAKADLLEHQKNERVLLSGLDSIRAKNGDLVLRTESLSLTISEFKKYNAQLTKEVKNLRIRIKDLQSATSVVVDTDVDAIIPIRDTIILNNVAKSFEYQDAYTKISGIVTDSVSLKYHSTDSLYIFHHIQPKRFLFFRWGIKRQWWDIKNSNHNNTIRGFEVIEVRK